MAFRIGKTVRSLQFKARNRYNTAVMRGKTNRFLKRIGFLKNVVETDHGLALGLTRDFWGKGSIVTAWGGGINVKFEEAQLNDFKDSATPLEDKLEFLRDVAKGEITFDHLNVEKDVIPIIEQFGTGKLETAAKQALEVLKEKIEPAAAEPETESTGEGISVYVAANGSETAKPKTVSGDNFYGVSVSPLGAESTNDIDAMELKGRTLLVLAASKDKTLSCTAIDAYKRAFKTYEEQLDEKFELEDGIEELEHVLGESISEVTVIAALFNGNEVSVKRIGAAGLFVDRLEVGEGRIGLTPLLKKNSLKGTISGDDFFKRQEEIGGKEGFLILSNLKQSTLPRKLNHIFAKGRDISSQELVQALEAVTEGQVSVAAVKFALPKREAAAEPAVEVNNGETTSISVRRPPPLPTKEPAPKSVVPVESDTDPFAHTTIASSGTQENGDSQASVPTVAQEGRSIAIPLTKPATPASDQAPTVFEASKPVVKKPFFTKELAPLFIETTDMVILKKLMREIRMGEITILPEEKRSVIAKLNLLAVRYPSLAKEVDWTISNIIRVKNI